MDGPYPPRTVPDARRSVCLLSNAVNSIPDPKQSIIKLANLISVFCQRNAPFLRIPTIIMVKILNHRCPNVNHSLQKFAIAHRF